jgi:hypothetical protein
MFNYWSKCSCIALKVPPVPLVFCVQVPPVCLSVIKDDNIIAILESQTAKLPSVPAFGWINV